MFDFVVRRLGWLGRVPLVPQVFDAGLLAWTALVHRRRLAAMEALEAQVREWPGMDRLPHRRGGIEFRQDGREIAHLHGNGLLDVLLGRERAAAVVQSGIALPHHVLGPSAWVSVWLRNEADLPSALRLMRQAGELQSRAQSRTSSVPARVLSSTGHSVQRSTSGQ